MQRCRALFAANVQPDVKDVSWTVGILSSYMSKMTLARVKAGDFTALTEYSEWLGSIPLKSWSDYRKQVLEPLRRYPNDPAVKRLPDEVWAPEARPTAPKSSDIFELAF
jgi:hypothetical protein